MAIAENCTDRLERALAGAVLDPPVRGLTFVDPLLLPGPGGSARSAASALAHAAGELRLDFAFVPSWEPWALEAVVALDHVEVAPLWVVPGVVWPALEQLGVDEGLRLSMREPERLAKAMDAALASARAAAEAGVRARARALVVADDMAGATGPLLDGRWLAAEAFPRLAQLVAVARSAGRPALLHCDGDARSLLASVRDAGFLALHGDCGEEAGVAAALEAARAVGVALVGGLSTAALTDAAHGALAGTLAAMLARRGGLLVADDGGLTTPEQVAALFAGLGASSG